MFTLKITSNPDKLIDVKSVNNFKGYGNVQLFNGNNKKNGYQKRRFGKTLAFYKNNFYFVKKTVTQNL